MAQKVLLGEKIFSVPVSNNCLYPTSAACKQFTFNSSEKYLGTLSSLLGWKAIQILVGLTMPHYTECMSRCIKRKESFSKVWHITSSERCNIEEENAFPNL